MAYTVDQLFKTMNERFKPEVAGDLKATVVYEFGDGRTWTVRISNGAVKVDSGDSAHGQEHVRVIFKNEDVMLGIIANTINPLKAFFHRDLGVVGNWKLLVRVRSSFETPSELI